MYRILEPSGKFLIITASPETYEERKTFYEKYEIKGDLLVGTFDLGAGKKLTDTTLYLHAKENILHAINNSGLVIDNIGQIGKAQTSDRGLYIVIEGHKP